MSIEAIRRNLIKQIDANTDKAVQYKTHYFVRDNQLVTHYYLEGENHSCDFPDCPTKTKS